LTVVLVAVPLAGSMRKSWSLLAVHSALPSLAIRRGSVMPATAKAVSVPAGSAGENLTTSPLRVIQRFPSGRRRCRPRWRVSRLCTA